MIKNFSLENFVYAHVTLGIPLFFSVIGAGIGTLFDRLEDGFNYGSMIGFSFSMSAGCAWIQDYISFIQERNKEKEYNEMVRNLERRFSTEILKNLEAELN